MWKEKVATATVERWSMPTARTPTIRQPVETLAPLFLKSKRQKDKEKKVGDRVLNQRDQRDQILLPFRHQRRDATFILSAGKQKEAEDVTF